MRRPLLTLILTLTLILAAGCSRTSGPAAPFDADAGRDVGPVFDGRTAEPVAALDLRERLEAADVVLLGEVHSDPAAHRAQRRIARAALPGPGGGGALALEMLTRLDARKVRRLDRAEDLERTGLADWPRWREFYLPTIQAAREAGVPVVAANAPREYAVLARTGGYGELRSLDPKSRRLFDLPPADHDFGGYEDRFRREMGGLHDDGDGADYFAAQTLWDATMARSAALAFRRYGGPVVLLAGSFHGDYDGGLVQLMRRRGLDVLTVSLIPADAARLRPEDAGRADVVVYTGELDPDDPDAAAEAIAEPPTPAARPLPAAPATTARPATAPATLPATTRPIARRPAVVGRGPAAPATVPATLPGLDFTK